MVSAPYVLTSTPADGHATTVLTMNELDGCMEGINQHRLAVALLIADAEAADALLGAKQYDLGMPLHYLVADRSGDAFVWERVGEQPIGRRPDRLMTQRSPTEARSCLVAYAWQGKGAPRAHGLGFGADQGPGTGEVGSPP